MSYTPTNREQSVLSPQPVIMSPLPYLREHSEQREQSEFKLDNDTLQEYEDTISLFSLRSKVKQEKKNNDNAMLEKKLNEIKMEMDILKEKNKHIEYINQTIVPDYLAKDTRNEMIIKKFINECIDITNDGSHRILNADLNAIVSDFFKKYNLCLDFREVAGLMRKCNLNYVKSGGKCFYKGIKIKDNMLDELMDIHQNQGN